MEIFVSGSNGFVGKNLVPYLVDHSYHVQPISRVQLQNGEFNFSQNSTIIHLAGKAHDLANTSDAASYYEVNFGLTKQIFDAFLKSDAKKFIFISSVKAAADKVSGTLTEDTMPEPLTHYGKSKLLAERYIQSQVLPNGKSFYILRPCMIHGPGNKGNLNLLYQVVKRGIPYPLGAYKNRRSFLSVQNLCFILQELISQNIESGIYNVADDSSLSTIDLVNQIASAIDRKPFLLNIPAGLINGIAKIGDICHLPLNSERLSKLTENYVVSNKKILSAINKPLPMLSNGGIRNTILSF